MLVLKLIHVSKRGPWCLQNWQQCDYGKEWSKHEPSGPKAWTFWENKVNVVTTDAPAPCVARWLTVMISLKI